MTSLFPTSASNLTGGSALRRKHTVVIAALVCISLVLLGSTEMFFTLKEARRQVGRAQSAQAAELANSVRVTLGLIERQLLAVTSLPWNGPGWLSAQDRREEYLRLMKIAPSIESLEYVDGVGSTLLRVSRRDVDSVGEFARPSAAMSPTPIAAACVYSAVTYTDDYEPSLTVEVAGYEHPAGKTIAHVSLRALADEIDPALTVASSTAYVVAKDGTVVLHRNHSLMLERRKVLALPSVISPLHDTAEGLAGIGLDGNDVISTAATLQPLGWIAVIEQERSVALAPVRAALLRTGVFLLVGLLMSLAGAYYLASRLTRPILSLHDGVRRLSEGDFSAQINVRTGDELEQLGVQFNRMSERLRDLYANLEQRVAEKTTDLEMANRHMAEFLANMSHELRTPLNAVIGMSDALLDENDYGPLNDKQREYLRDVNASGEHLLSLINDILDLAKVEAGRVELAKELVDIPSAIAKAAALLRQRALEKRVQINSHLDSSVSVFNVDPRRFKQIMVNLLSNAVKFTASGGVVTIRSTMRSGTLQIEVEDSGCGIAVEDQQLVFEKFRRFGKEQTEGTGLGLSLVRELVRLHDGQITLRSHLGVGTTMAVLIPHSS